MNAMCKQAVATGLESIAFTEHVEWQRGRVIMPPLDEYFEDIKECRRRFGRLGLTVLSGVELGNPQDHKDAADTLLSKYHFDVVIASLHWLHGENIQMEACFQGRDPLDVYADYFIALGEMAATVDADIIAHFDRIMWRGALLGMPLEPHQLESIIRDALATIAWRNIALELNTRYLRAEPNWRNELLRMLHWFREEGGTRVVIDSDAHGTWQLGANYDTARRMLDIAGLKPAVDIRTPRSINKSR
jgi:histidinol-phosphatase (PHP family)